jgi:uncharacterized BrkB/YihY/UPF0761 family membrane protein
MFGRKMALVVLLVCTVVGPAAILSDTEPAWGVAWLRYAAAGTVGLACFGLFCLYGALCRSGDLSRIEERAGR